jgi:hypothetical protein
MGVRKITNAGTKKNIGKFPSLKMRRNIWYESLLERDAMYLLEFDPEVISYREQEPRIRYWVDSKEHRYTPDLLVGRKHKKQIIEVKPKKALMDETYNLLFHIITPICREQGYEFVVWTEDGIRMQPRLEIVKTLWRYARTPLHPQHQIYCHEFFSARREAGLEETARFFASKKITKRVVFALIYWGIISIDLTTPIGPNSVLRLP